MRKTTPRGRAALTTVAPWLTLSAILLALGTGAVFGQPANVASPLTAEPAPVVKDPAALSLLQRMCDRLQSAKTFTVRGRASLELPVTGGELATFFNDFDVAVRRPDGLSTRRSGDLPEFRFVFDGKSMTVYVPGLSTWGTTPAPATLDAMLPVAGEQGGLNMPFDELLVADPYAAITAGLTDAIRVDQATIQGKNVDHLVLSGADFRVEYWIDPGTELPARSLVVYVYHPLRPHFIADFAEWKLDPKLPESTFDLPKPQGATDVGFREAAGAFQ
jgi:hypothetical protein